MSAQFRPTVIISTLWLAFAAGWAMAQDPVETPPPASDEVEEAAEECVGWECTEFPAGETSESVGDPCLLNPDLPLCTSKEIGDPCFINPKLPGCSEDPCLVNPNLLDCG